MHRFPLLTFALLFAVAGNAQLKSQLRLPAGVRPLKYQATLDVTPGKDSFSAAVEILIAFDKPTSDVTLHAKEIEFVKVTPPPREIEKGDNDLVTLHYAQPFATNTAQLKIDYTGSISRVLTDGAFQQQHAGDWYVFTKFEPITARRVFPCFDEPGFKVPWQLSLRVPNNLKAFSNTAIASEEAVADGRKIIHFGETRPLPSYLVAFAVGPFDVVDTAPVGRNHVQSRILVPKGRAQEAEYAASITPKLIEMLEGYFGSPYPYEKLDQVVVPLTTAWGAMENAGMIAYGDNLLSSKAQDSESRRQRAALTMEHEMSHQWFGDLVTMKWWDDIWLNEAFASWISNKLVAGWHPQWRIEERRAASPGIFEADSLTSARRIRQPIETAGDIGTAFDGITYGKGLAVIGMFEHYVGEQKFADGVREYLKAHSWGNATADDLLSALDKRLPGVGEAFASFLNQVGFPLIDVRLDCDFIRLTQKRLAPKGSTANSNALWGVPVCLSWDSGSDCILMKSVTYRYSLKPSDQGSTMKKVCPSWVFADRGATGYYATAYASNVNFYLQKQVLRQLSATEKAAFVRNSRVLFASGLGDMEQELRTAAMFSSDLDPNLSEASAAMLGSTDKSVGLESGNAYATRIRQLYGGRAHDLGWRPKAGDSPEIKDLRRELLPLVATKGGDEELMQQARTLGSAWLKDHSVLEAEMVAQVLYAAAWGGDSDLFHDMTAALRSTNTQRERSWIIAGLSGFRDTAIAEQVLEMIGSPGLDAREMSRVLFDASAETRDTTWQFIQANFDKLNQLLPSARGVPFGATLPNAVAGFCDTAHADQVSAFFDPRLKAMSGGARNLARALERINLCAAQSELAKPAVLAFLRP